MGTKAIREALDWLENYLDHNHEAQKARRRARVEVAAIERAAKVLNRAEVFCGAEVGRDDFDAMCATVASIARDAP